MIETFLSGGVMMWPMLVVAIGVAGITLRAAACLWTRAPLEDVRKKLNAIVFWGAMGALLGLLGTVVGLVRMAQVIQRFGAVEAPLVWGGVAVSLVSLIFGISILLFSGVAWLVLQQWTLRAVEREGAGPS